MAKGLNQVQVGLTFTVDSGNAKAQLQELKKTIDSLYSSTAKKSPMEGLSDSTQKALTSAAKLKTALEAATNVDTGRLDLSKFSQQLNKSNLSLKAFAQDLTNLGVEGERAFMQLAQSIVTAEVPMRKANAQLTEMWTSLKNTARWQLSSSVLHGFMGAVQSAYGYAQDLNESLNDIRIVTGQNVDQMAKFATEANKAAKSLSTTTTEYTNASLIYFQQGLTDSEVRERTDITIKMANVAKESAQTVSDQMTAVWNNFYDGSKSLEYYSDVMVKLGADTASSTDEIAGGLEKFAAVANTVGLSYEYAASALATITAKTRQSEDVVGTALKTIFARIEGLNLGETLDDGTDLNKYSVALKTVGVDIKDASGQLKDMDDILDDLGSRWQTLERDQKVAVAQTVAGVRQYNQLISLMDNWEFFQENLATSYNASGALNEQAKIYAESWEAARDRVTASMETIYSNLLNDKFFISLTNGFSGVLNIVDKLTDTLGGLPGILSLVGIALVRVFGSQMTNSFNQGFENLKVSIGQARLEADQMRKKAIEAVQEFNKGLEGSQLYANNKPVTYSSQLTDASQLQNLSTEAAEGQVMIDQIGRAYELQQISEKISETKAQELKEMMAIEEQYGKNMVAAKKEADEATNAYTRMKSSTINKAVDKGVEVGKAREHYDQLQKTLNGSFDGGWLKGLDKIIDDDVPEHVQQIEEATQKWALANKTTGESLGMTTSQMQKMAKAFLKQKSSLNQSEEATEAYYKRLGALTKELNANEKKMADFGKGATQTVKGLSSLTFGVSNLVSSFKALQDENMSGFDKFTTVFTSVTMILPSVINGLGEVKKGFSELKASADGLGAGIVSRVLGLNEETVAALMAAHAQDELNKEKEEEQIIDAVPNIESEKNINEAATTTIKKGAVKELNEEKQKENIQDVANLALDKLKNAEDEKGLALTVSEVAALKLENIANKDTTTSIFGLVGAKIAEATANKLLASSMSPVLAGLLTFVAAAAPYVLAAAGIAAIAVVVARSVNKEAEALKEAQEREQRAADTAQKATETFSELSNSLDKISNAKDTFKELEEGTLEWQQALNEVNSEVQQLINKYPELITMGAIVSDNGILGITKSGQEYITKKESSKVIAANNASLRAQQNTLQTKMDNSWDDFKLDDNDNSILNKYAAKSLVASYLTMGEGLFKNTEMTSQAFDDLADNSTTGFADESSYTDKEKQELVQRNENLIKEQAQRLEQINSIDAQILQSKMVQYGSQRSLEQITDLIRENAKDYLGYQIEGTGNSKQLIYTADGENKTFNMNRSVNYDENNLPQEIQDFMELQGEDSEYVAQRSGKLVLKIDEKEVEFTEDEVYTTLGELYSENSALATSLQKKLSSYSSSAFSDLSVEDLVSLDNVLLGIEAGLENQFSGEKLSTKINDAFSGVILAYGSGTEDLKKLAEDTEYIDVSNSNFQRLITNTQLSGEELQTAIQELNASEKLATKGDWFAEEAASVGMTDEAATEMQEYAKYLMETAGEIDGFSEELDKDADAVADLAVQIVRMNKGIEDLSEGFEDWNKTLSTSKRGSLDYVKALNSMKSSVADVLDVEADTLSEDFITQHSEEIKKVSEGDAEAIDKLRSAMDEDIIQQIKLERPDLTNLDELDSDVKSKLDDALKELDVPDIKIGATLDNTGLLEAANEIVDTSQMTADEANTYFKGIGYEPLYATTDIEGATSMESPNVETVTQLSGIGFSEQNFTIGDTEIPIKAPQFKLTTTSKTLDNTPSPADMSLTSVSGDGKPPAPIKALRRIASGSSGSGRGSKKGSGSGGGSKSSSKPSKITKTKKSDTVERYKELTDRIDDVTRALDKAGDASDRLYGAGKIKAMNKQITLLKQERSLLEQKTKQAKAYLQEDKKALNKAASDAGVSFSYDKSGNISNYTSQLTKLHNQLNAAQDKANKMSTKDAQDDYKENVLDPLQEKIDALKEAVEQYDETRELLQDLDQETIEIDYKIEDLNFEKFTYTVELKLEIEERDQEYLDYLLGNLDNQSFKSAQRIDVWSKQAANVEQESGIIRSGLNKMMKDNLNEKDYEKFSKGQIGKINFNKYIEDGTLSEAEIEQMKEWSSQLLEYNQELMEIRDSISREILVAYEEWNEKIDEQMSVLDHYGAIVDYLQDIADLTQSVTGFDSATSNALAAANTEMALNKNEAAKAEYDYQVATYEKAQKDFSAVKSKLSDQEKQAWEETLSTMKQGVMEAEEELYSSTAEVISAAIDQFTKAFDNAVKDFEKELTGSAEGFASWTAVAERQQSISERFLKDYQKTYELSKLNRDILKSIDDTDNLAAKERLLKVQEKLNRYAADDVQMSQYELDYLQKEYELEKAKIALEESQNAKNTVRMSRDSEGNWGYVYTADEDKVADAQQSYEEKLYEITNLTHEYADEVSNVILSTYQEFSDALADIQSKWQDGVYASEEEYQTALESTTQFYQEQLGYQYDQLNITTGNSKALYEDEWLAYQFSTNQRITDNKSFQTSFDQTIAGMTTGYSSGEQALQDFNSNVGDGTTGLLGTLCKNYDNATKQINSALGSIDTKLGDVGESIKKKLGSAKEKESILGKAYSAKKSVQNYCKQAKDAMDGVIKKTKDWQDKHSEYMDTIITKNTDAYKSYKQVINEASKAVILPSAKSSSTESSTSTQSSGTTSTPKTLKTTQGDGEIQVGDQVSHKNKVASYSGGSYVSIIDAYKGKKLYVQMINGNWVHLGTAKTYSSSTGVGWVKKSDISGYDTGGYTGKWGKEGKLAFLHEKELVLNANDTKNLLDTMSVLKDVINTVSLQSILPDVSKIAAQAVPALQQDVTIHAEFPNVSDHNEVEEALKNLINTTSQYVNRK